MSPELSDIARLRKKLGLKQTELAKLAGVSQSLIAKIEHGSVDPSYGKAKRIFDALEKVGEKEGLKAKDVACLDLVSVSKRDSVEKAIRLMEKNTVSQLPVFDGKSLVGTITERGILDRVTKGEDLSKVSKKKVEQVMHEAFPRVDEDTPLPAVSALLKYREGVLVTKKGQVIGIITKSDLLKVVSR